MISEKPFSFISTLKLFFTRERKNPFVDDNKFLMGRDALEYGLLALGIKEGDNVLFPAYTCIEPLLPFLKYKCVVHYYDINDDLKPDFEEIIKTIRSKDIKIFFWINYFGVIAPEYSILKNECHDTDILFIEDCSHSLLSADSGKTGDIVFASLRKVLPLPDGGIIKSEKVLSLPRYKNKLIADLSSLAILVKTFSFFKNIKLSRTKIKSAGKSSYSELPVNNDFIPSSHFCDRLIKRIDYEEEVRERRSKFLYWDSILKSINYIPLVPNLDVGVCPTGYPIIIKNRDEVLRHLKRKGIYLKVDWELPEIIDIKFRNSIKIAKNSVTLPVHRNVNKQDLLMIRDEIIKLNGTDWRISEN